jgi:hypothetical protein
MANQISRSVSEFLVRYIWRAVIWILTVCVGWAAKHFEEIFFDGFVYGSVSKTLLSWLGQGRGTLVTFIVMSVISIIMCLIYLRVYDTTKRDWFGFEVCKSLKINPARDSFFWRLFHRLSLITIYLALCAWTDPFMVTVYFRKGENQYSGMARRDWKIFWSSVFVSNALWTLLWVGIWQLPDYWHTVSSFLNL